MQATCFFLSFSISTERHRAEVRRVVNDDSLNAVAEWYVLYFFLGAIYQEIAQVPNR